MSTQKPQHSPSRVSFPKSERKAVPGATAASKTDPQSNISVSVIVKRKNPLNLEKLTGRHLSQQEFSEMYAADPANFDHLRDFAHKHGLTVDEGASSLARRTLVLRGPASKMEAAFGVTLNDYSKDGKKFHSYTGTISMPQEHAEPVEAVLGLDNHPIARPHFRLLDNKKKRKPAQTAFFNPPQVAQLYNFPTGVNGAGQTIGILELGGGYNPSDLSSYFAGLSITEPRVTAVSVDGATNSPTDPNADGEVALDIEVAGSIAPGANIAVYFTTNSSQGFVDALTTAIHDTTNGPPSVISISWGSPESNWTAQSMTALDEACQSAAALGISITVASGDNGSSDGASGNNVDFPASSPHVLGCGGTELTSANGAIQEEVVWNDQPQGGGASGGGVSTVFPLPSWQTNANVPRHQPAAADAACPTWPATPLLRPVTTSCLMGNRRWSAGPAQSPRSGLRSSPCSTSSEAAISALPIPRCTRPLRTASTISPRAITAAIRRGQAGTPAPVLARPMETSCRRLLRHPQPVPANRYPAPAQEGPVTAGISQNDKSGGPGFNFETWVLRAHGTKPL